MLILAGLGLYDELDINLKTVEFSKICTKIFIEKYTGIWKGNLKNLEKILGKKIYELRREDLEDKSYEIIEMAKKENIMILIQGDPLILTTHFSLIMEAIKNNVEYKVIHNSSIINVVAETGLHIYKFGEIITLHKKFDAESIKKRIEKNLKNDLHTLCVSDIDLNLSEALSILEKFLDKEIFIIISAGSKKEKIIYGKIADLKNLNFEGEPFSIVIPSNNLHFTEKEAIEFFKK